jgi:hypothetical protein
MSAPLTEERIAEVVALALRAKAGDENVWGDAKWMRRAIDTFDVFVPPVVDELRAARAALRDAREVIERHKVAYVGCRRPISLIEIEISERAASAALPPGAGP